MKDVQCYELFGGIALKNHAFSFFSFFIYVCLIYVCLLTEIEFDVGLEGQLTYV